MSFESNPEVFQTLSPKITHTQPYSFSSSFDDYEDQIITYFSDRSPHTAYRWDTAKLKNRFEKACRQVEGLVLLQELE